MSGSGNIPSDQAKESHKTDIKSSSEGIYLRDLEDRDKEREENYANPPSADPEEIKINMEHRSSLISGDNVRIPEDQVQEEVVRPSGLEFGSAERLTVDTTPESTALDTGRPEEDTSMSSHRSSFVNKPPSAIHSPKVASALLDQEFGRLQYPSHAITVLPKSDSDQIIQSSKLGIQWDTLDDYLNAKGSSDTDKSEKKSVFMLYSLSDRMMKADRIRNLKPETTNLSDLLKKKNFWLNCYNPSYEEMKLLSNTFNIHPLTTEDILTENTREKFELYKNYYFICYCAFDENPESENYLSAFNVYLLVFHDFILTFHFDPLPAVDRVIFRLDQLKAYLKITSHWISYALLDDITDKFAPLIRSSELEVDAIDDLILVIPHTEQADMLRRMANARKQVTTLQRLLSAKSDVLKILIKRLEGISINGMDGVSAPTSKWTAMVRDTCLYLGDVQDHVITMFQTLSHIDLTLNRCHSNYLAHINIEITQSFNRSNEAMNKLTAIASVTIPLNIITGLWGMNVKVPGQVEDSDSYAWFIGLAVFMILCLLGGYTLIWKSGLMKQLSTSKNRP